jgi:hypothetical protein
VAAAVAGIATIVLHVRLRREGRGGWWLAWLGAPPIVIAPLLWLFIDFVVHFTLDFGPAFENSGPIFGWSGC